MKSYKQIEATATELIQVLESAFPRAIDETAMSQIKCEVCFTGYMVLRNGQYGKFYGCTNYPECYFTKDFT